MDISKAIHTLVPQAEFIVESNSFNKIRWLSKNIPQPTEEEIQTKLAELRNAEPLRLLRQERNRRIALTDWRFRSDLSPSQEWKDYCVALRDLPANYSPTFDILTEDEYPLVKEDNTTPWPEEPTDG
tara:strand:+ start:216 stop:596 length:381 start_codon:yes stop_codon:yes gene_type:complete